MKRSKFRNRVERAAAWFDKNYPGWFWKIPAKTEKFQIEAREQRDWDGKLVCGCVTVHAGIDWFDLPEYVKGPTLWGNMEIRHGDVPILQQDWVEVISERKQKARAAR